MSTNPWKEFDFLAKDQVHRLDREGVDNFNSKLEKSKSKSASRLLLSRANTPLPFFGALDATLIILAANPGLDPINTPQEETPERRRLFDQARRHELHSHPFVFLRPEFQNTPGYTWWEKRTRQLREAVGDDVFLNRTFSAEIHPYKSQNYKPLHEPLPTQGYTFSLVNELVRNGAFVILVRAKNEWCSAVPSLQHNDRVIELNSKQSSYLTERNMPVGAFSKLAAHVSR